jgi:hypothetical protein
MTIHSSGKVWTTSTRQVAVELDAKFKRSDWTSTYPGHGEVYPSVKGYSGNDGRYAIDLMCSSRSLGDKIAQFAWDNRKRLGIRYVIWYGRIISETSSTPNRWVRYFNADNPNPSKSHKNHVHISRYSNKGYTGPVAAAPVEDTEPNLPPADPKLFPGTAKFYLGVRASYVTLLGQRLVAHGWAGYEDGPGPLFTEVDEQAVLWFQRKQGWTGANATGIPGPETWRRLMLNPEPVVIPPIQVPPVEVPPILSPEPTPPVETPPVEVPVDPPVVVTPPVEPPVVVTPPVVKPPTVKPGIPGLVAVSLNTQWPGFAGTRAKAKAWSTRLRILIDKVKDQKPDIILTQEMGSAEAAAFYGAMGSDWEYQRFGPLNTVGWNKKKLTYVKTLEIDTPDYGQYPGRGYLESWLKDKNGNRLRIGSGHNPVKTAADGKYQEQTIQQIVSGVNNEKDDWPLIWGMDTNNRQSKNTGMWSVLKKYGYEWITNGIDAVFFNFGAVATKTKVVNLGDGSDHDMLVFKIRTTKK